MAKLVFEDGVNTDDRVYVQRGDIFTVSGLFKKLEDVDRDDHIIAKENRPVLVISANKNNEHIVKVLPLSSKQGNTDNNSISSARQIEIPNIKKGGYYRTFIDTSQIFTVNSSQLNHKLASVSQVIVDTAVEKAMEQLIEPSSIDTVVNLMREEYPHAEAFKTDMQYNVDNSLDPAENIYGRVLQVPLEELPAPLKEEQKERAINELFSNINTPKATHLWEEWKMLGTDMFRKTHNLSKTEYFNLRDKCIRQLLGKLQGFKKFDWEG